MLIRDNKPQDPELDAASRGRDTGDDTAYAREGRVTKVAGSFGDKYATRTTLRVRGHAVTQIDGKRAPAWLTTDGSVP